MIKTKKLSFIKILYINIFLLNNININSIVILIHGTFAADADWCKPGGKFYNKLKKEAKKINEKLIPFGWSGHLTNNARILAAEELAQVILTYKKDKKIILIGHSHGGNVINLASKMLDYPSKPPPDFNQLGDISAFMQAHRRLKKINSNLKKEYLIDQVYLLGTPIHLKKYPPNMKTIKYLCNLFSQRDNIQPVFGLYNQIIYKIERTVNLQITIDDEDVEGGHPTHCQMHHNIIAKWILSIPNNLKISKIGGFEQFSWNHDGKIHFNLKSYPLYKRNDKNYFFYKSEI